MRSKPGRGPRVIRCGAEPPYYMLQCRRTHRIKPTPCPGLIVFTTMTRKVKLYCDCPCHSPLNAREGESSSGHAIRREGILPPPVLRSTIELDNPSGVRKRVV